MVVSPKVGWWSSVRARTDVRAERIDGWDGSFWSLLPVRREKARMRVIAN
jgi:hypothetical protein